MAKLIKKNFTTSLTKCGRVTHEYQPSVIDYGNLLRKDEEQFIDLLKACDSICKKNSTD